MPIPRSAISTIMEPSIVRAALMETVVSGGEYRRELSSSFSDEVNDVRGSMTGDDSGRDLPEFDASILLDS